MKNFLKNITSKTINIFLKCIEKYFDKTIFIYDKT